MKTGGRRSNASFQVESFLPATTTNFCLPSDQTILGQPVLECMGMCVLSSAHEREMIGSLV